MTSEADERKYQARRADVLRLKGGDPTSEPIKNYFATFDDNMLMGHYHFIEEDVKRFREEFPKQEEASDALIKNYLEDPELLERINGELDKRIVGEKDARKVIFLVANMRNVANLETATDNLIVNAVSGTGKDHVTRAIFTLIPSNEKEELNQTTPKVLSYTRNRLSKDGGGATWKKVALRLEDVREAVVNDPSFKVFLSANPNGINRAKTLIKQKVVPIEIEGKPTLILTVAFPHIIEEGLRRLPMIFLTEDNRQSEAVINRQALNAEQGLTGLNVDYDPSLVEALSLLKRVSVAVPYATKLVQIFKSSLDNVIVRTVFVRFLDYIKSSASLFQFQRERDKNGNVIATEEDYKNGALCLKLTTNNLKLIPLSKLDASLYDYFKVNSGQELSFEMLENVPEIQNLGKSERWIRDRLDFLVSKKFLSRSSRSTYNKETKEGSFKPVHFYKYIPLNEFVIPEFIDLKDIGSYDASNSSNTSNASNSSIDKNKTNTTNSSNTHKKQASKPIKSKTTGVNEVFEVSEVKTHKSAFAEIPIIPQQSKPDVTARCYSCNDLVTNPIIMNGAIYCKRCAYSL